MAECACVALIKEGQQWTLGRYKTQNMSDVMEYAYHTQREGEQPEIPN